MEAWNGRTLIVLAATVLIVTGPVATGLGHIAEEAGSEPTNTLSAPASNAEWAREQVRQLDRATAVNDADGDKIFDTLEDRYELHGGPQDVIVVFQHDVDPEHGLEQAKQAAGGFQETFTFSIIPGFAATLPLDHVERIATLDDVRQIEWDTPGQPELDTARPSMGVDAVQQQLNITGDRDGDQRNWTPEDATIAVLDTGIDGEHVDFPDGKIIHFLEIATGENEPVDGGSHGTHVASIAAGTGDGNEEYRGVAPGASLIGLKITDPDGDEGSQSLAIKGYEWILENKDEYGIDVATISFGFGTATDGTTAIELAIDEIWDAGVVATKSTGNGGSDQRTITVPAAARGILAIGAMLDPLGGSSGIEGSQFGASHGFQLATFSSRGPTTDGRVKPDLAAPGVSITAANSGSDDGYISLSGTSMAAPFTAGSSALVLTANPNLTPDQVREIFYTTTEDWGVSGGNVDYGWGRIQVANAVAKAATVAGGPMNLTTPEVPFHETHSGKISPITDVPVPQETTAEVTIDVENTTYPFAVTAIVEGHLAQVTIEDPDGDIVASVQPSEPVARQHNVAFETDTTGEHTIRLVGEPEAPFSVDVTHGETGGLTLDVPTGITPLEEQAATPEEDPTDEVPSLGLLGVLVAGVLGLLMAPRRGR